MSLSPRQFFRNSVWTFLDLSLYPALMILATPLFTRQLGISEYGLLMLVSNITLALNFFNPGLAETNIRLISKFRAEQSEREIAEVVRYNFSLAAALMVVSVLIGWLLSGFHFISFFDHPTPSGNEDQIVLLACVLAGLKFIEVSFISIFKGFERFDIAARLNTLSKVTVLLVNIGLALKGYGLITILLSSVGTMSLVLFFELITLYRFNRSLLPRPSFSLLLRERKRLMNGFWYWLQGCISLGGFLSDKLLVASLSNTVVFGYYSIASTVATQIHTIFLALGGFAFPRVSFKMAAQSDISPMYFGARALIALPGWLIITTLIVAGDAIFQLWLGDALYLSSIGYIKLYLAFEAVMLLIIVPFHFLNGTHHIRLNSLFELVIRTMHIAGMLVGYWINGINGVLPALIITSLVNIPFQYYFFHKTLLTNIQPAQTILVVLPALLICTLCYIASIPIQLVVIAVLLYVAKVIYADPATPYTLKLLGFRKENRG